MPLAVSCLPDAQRFFIKTVSQNFRIGGAAIINLAHDEASGVGSIIPYLLATTTNAGIDLGFQYITGVHLVEATIVP